jgi:hypothetical protein
MKWPIAPSLSRRVACLGATRYPPAPRFAEGQRVRELGIVLRDRVWLRTLVPERGMVTNLTVEPGDIFGRSALVLPYRSTLTWWPPPSSIQPPADDSRPRPP